MWWVSLLVVQVICMLLMIMWLHSVFMFRRTHANTRRDSLGSIVAYYCFVPLFWWLGAIIIFTVNRRESRTWFTKLDQELRDAEPAAQISVDGSVWRNGTLRCDIENMDYDPKTFGAIVFALQTYDGDGIWVLTSGGKVFTFGGAIFA